MYTGIKTTNIEAKKFETMLGIFLGGVDSAYTNFNNYKSLQYRVRKSQDDLVADTYIKFHSLGTKCLEWKEYHPSKPSTEHT